MKTKQPLISSGQVLPSNGFVVFRTFQKKVMTTPNPMPNGLKIYTHHHSPLNTF